MGKDSSSLIYDLFIFNVSGIGCVLSILIIFLKKKKLKKRFQHVLLCCPAGPEPDL